jgi:hypothetical protein
MQLRRIRNARRCALLHGHALFRCLLLASMMRNHAALSASSAVSITNRLRPPSLQGRSAPASLSRPCTPAASPEEDASQNRPKSARWSGFDNPI